MTFEPICHAGLRAASFDDLEIKVRPDEKIPINQKGR